MKAKSRKRLLISSIAMLLVAMLALGTATFAWFTTNTTAHADGVKAATTKVSQLLLSKSDRTDWKTHIEYGFDNDAMYPATSIDGSAWWNLTAANGTAYNADFTTAASTVTGDDDYVFAEELNIMNAGAEELSNIKITIKNFAATDSTYAYIALVPVGDQATEVKTTNGTFSQCLYSKAADSYKAVTANAASESTTTYTSKAYTTKIAVPDLGPQERAYYKLYVWFEGQDTDCKNVNSGQKLTGLDFEVKVEE